MNRHDKFSSILVICTRQIGDVLLTTPLIRAARLVPGDRSLGWWKKLLLAEVRDVASAPRLIDASGRLDLSQLTVLLAGAALYLGPDTSITHLVAACATPVVALFGPTQQMIWGPWPQGRSAGELWSRNVVAQSAGRVVLMQGPGACEPCGRSRWAVSSLSRPGPRDRVPARQLKNAASSQEAAWWEQ